MAGKNGDAWESWRYVEGGVMVVKSIFTDAASGRWVPAHAPDANFPNGSTVHQDVWWPSSLFELLRAISRCLQPIHVHLPSLYLQYDSKLETLLTPAPLVSCYVSNRPPVNPACAARGRCIGTSRR